VEESGSKYGSEWGDWCSSFVVGSHCVGFWKHIGRGWDSFSRSVSFEVGHGTNVLFGKIGGAGRSL
jgi:hypothetical protein